MTGLELVFITDPALSDKELESLQKNIKMSLSKSEGKLVHEYVWGRRRLAYELRVMILVFTTHGTLQGVVKQWMNYKDNLDIQIMFCAIRLLK